jgi:hypothetical protein
MSIIGGLKGVDEASVIEPREVDVKQIFIVVVCSLPHRGRRSRRGRSRAVAKVSSLRIGFCWPIGLPRVSQWVPGRVG